MESIKLFKRGLIDALKPTYGEAEAHTLSKWLIEHICENEWLRLSLESDRSFSPDEWARAEPARQRLLAHEPIQYITGIAHFYGHEFIITPDVLIPRHETEELVSWAKDCLETKSQQSALHILDIGTGSGCIPISLALSLGGAHNLIALDINANAIKVAQQNAKKHKIKMACVHMNIFEAEPNTFAGLDLIVSNPPYVPIREKKELLPNVAQYEPPDALFVSNDEPLVFYREILRLAAHWLKPGGFLLFEIHADMGTAMKQLLDDSIWEPLGLRTDVHGRDRMIGVRKL